jgi:hypothetical protein
MTVETATFISDLIVLYPAATDVESEGDDHIRLVKSTIKTTFPNVSGAVTPTHTAINQLTTAASANAAGNVTIASPSSGSALTILGSEVVSVGTGSGAYREGLRLEGSGSNSGDVSCALSFSGSNINAAIWSLRYFSFGGDLIFATQPTAGGTPTEKLRVTSDGRFYGTAIHNNAGAVTGTTNQYFASGTYIPTLTNVVNATSLSPSVIAWSRVGNVVTVCFFVTFSLTSGSVFTEIGISLPIPSNLGTGPDLTGNASATASSDQSAMIMGDPTNDRARMFFTAGASTASRSFSGSFVYVIL